MIQMTLKALVSLTAILFVAQGCQPKAAGSHPPPPGTDGGTGGLTGTFITPSQVAGDVVISVDSHSTRSISPYLYGLNFAEQTSSAPSGGLWGAAVPAFTLNRFGGNRLSTQSWESGDSNCGADCGTTYPNDDNLLANVGASAGVGASVKPRVAGDFALNAGTLLTVPIIGYVARDASGAQPIPTAPDSGLPGTPAPAHWLAALPNDPGGATANPNTTDGFAYTDDFVAWVRANYPTATTDPARTIQFELDNEPDYWGGSHPEVRGNVLGGPNGGEVATGFDELISRSLDHAKAIKSVLPAAVVWGGVFGGFDGLTQLNYNAHPNGPPPGFTYYLDYFLQRLQAAESNSAYGARMMDVLDLHWYVQDPNVTNDDLTQDATVIEAREQAPRSLWDPYYIENSWVTAAIPAADAQNCNSSGFCPIALIPRVQNRINQFYPGTKLGIDEYWYGRGGDISGAIANADLLGIFARTGVYGAAMWPNSSNIWAYNTPNNCQNSAACSATHAYACALDAIKLFRDYDGAGSTFGNTYVGTAVSDPAYTSPATQNERVTAYTGLDATNPDRMVIVAINKSLTSSINAGFELTHIAQFHTAKAYVLTGVNGGAGGCTGPTAQPGISLTLTNAFNVSLPPQSVTVIALSP